MTTENIRLMENQCKKLDQTIQKKLKAIPQTLTTIPGIASTPAASIIAEILAVNRFDGEKALAKF